MFTASCSRHDFCIRPPCRMDLLSAQGLSLELKACWYQNLFQVILKRVILSTLECTSSVSGLYCGHGEVFSPRGCGSGCVPGQPPVWSLTQPSPWSLTPAFIYTHGTSPPLRPPPRAQIAFVPQRHLLSLTGLTSCRFLPSLGLLIGLSSRRSLKIFISLFVSALYSILVESSAECCFFFKKTSSRITLMRFFLNERVCTEQDAPPAVPSGKVTQSAGDVVRTGERNRRGGGRPHPRSPGTSSHGLGPPCSQARRGASDQPAPVNAYPQPSSSPSSRRGERERQSVGMLCNHLVRSPSRTTHFRESESQRVKKEF